MCLITACGVAMPSRLSSAKAGSIDDGVNEQVQPGRPVELALEGPVAQFSEAVEEQCSRKGVLSLALVETGGRVPAHFGVLPPLGPDRPEADEVERPFSNGIKCLTWSC